MKSPSRLLSCVKEEQSNINFSSYVAINSVNFQMSITSLLSWSN